MDKKETKPTSEQISLKKIPMMARKIIAGLAGLNGLFIVVLVVAVTYLGIKGRNEKITSFENSATALATALGPSIKSDDPTAIQNMAVEIAKAGKFALVIITDANGRVIGSTDRRLDHKIFKEMAKAPRRAKGYQSNERFLCDCAIVYAGKTLGAIRIQLLEGEF